MPGRNRELSLLQRKVRQKRTKGTFSNSRTDPDTILSRLPHNESGKASPLRGIAIGVGGRIRSIEDLQLAPAEPNLRRLNALAFRFDDEIVDSLGERQELGTRVFRAIRNDRLTHG